MSRCTIGYRHYKAITKGKKYTAFNNLLNYCIIFIEISGFQASVTLDFRSNKLIKDEL